MSNDNQIERLWKLQAKVNMLVLDGKRDPKTVADVLQGILGTSPRSWREEDGVIYFSVTSDGATGPQWITRLEKKGSRFTKWSKDVLLSTDFKPTTGVTTDVAVFKGILWSNNNCITSNIRAIAESRRFTKPNPEIACLIREKFTDEEIEAMGLLYIVAMHEPIKDSDGGLNLLEASRIGDGRWLDTCGGTPDCRWARDRGFAFVVSQVST